MSFLKDITLPETKPETPVKSGGFLGRVEVPEDKARAREIYGLRVGAFEAEKEATEASKLSTIAKETGLDLFSRFKEAGIDTTKGLFQTYRDFPKKIAEDIEAGAEEFQVGKSGKGLLKSGGRVAGDVASVIFAPIGSMIGAVLQLTGGQNLIDKTGKVIADKSGITDLEAFQDFAMTHPNAGEDFERISTLLMSKFETGEINPKKFSGEINSFVKKIIPTEAPSIAKEVAIQTPKVKGGFLESVEKVHTTEKIIIEEPIIQEAKKYKSAEEFVNKFYSESTYSFKQGTTIMSEEGFKGSGLYHGATNIQSILDSGKIEARITRLDSAGEKVVSLTKSRGGAESYGIVFELDESIPHSPIKKGIVKDGVEGFEFRTQNDIPLSKVKSVTLPVNKSEGLFSKILIKFEGGKPMFKTASELAQDFKNKGIKVYFNDGTFGNKSQLKEIWEKAQEPVTQELLKAPITGVGLKKSKVASSIEARAIEKGLTEGFDGVAGYDPITIKGQAIKVADLIKNDLGRVERIMRGEEALPSGVRASSILIGLENLAQKTGNIKLLNDLANSPLVAETSVFAQELRMLRERTPLSPVKIIKDIKDVREKKFQERTKTTVKKATETEITKIKKEIKKSSSGRQGWDEFINEIKCK